jgi:nitric oxide synthase oxygenase domain/subunit
MLYKQKERKEDCDNNNRSVPNAERNARRLAVAGRGVYGRWSWLAPKMHLAKRESADQSLSTISTDTALISGALAAVLGSL